MFGLCENVNCRTVYKVYENYVWDCSTLQFRKCFVFKLVTKPFKLYWISVVLSQLPTYSHCSDINYFPVHPAHLAYSHIIAWSQRDSLRTSGLCKSQAYDNQCFRYEPTSFRGTYSTPATLHNLQHRHRQLITQI